MATIFKRGGKANRDGVYYVAFTDEAGRRQTVCTATTDRDAAKQIAAKLAADAALRKRGVLDPKLERFAAENLKPLAQHVGDYLADCEPRQSRVHVNNKRTQLKRLCTVGGFARLSDLEPDAVGAYLRGLLASGLSHRTHNQHRATIIGFLNWCVDTRRLAVNHVGVVKPLDERRDERRRRRAATDEELARLLAVPEAVASGRTLYYQFSALSGLRVGALKRLQWQDIDLDAGTVTIRRSGGAGGTKGEFQELPLHPDLLDALRSARPAFAHPACRVFPRVPTIRTFHRDCQRAGVARVDADGRRLDRHALRTTFGTRLSLAGVLPQTAQKLMGHSDVRVTMKHYTKLRLSDVAGALAAVPSVKPIAALEAAERATGTTGGTANNPRIARSAWRSAQAAQNVLRLAPTGKLPGTDSATVVATGNAVSPNIDGTSGVVRHPLATGGIDSNDRFAILPKSRAVGAVG